MSTRTIIRSLEQQGALRRYVPEFTLRRARRRLYLGPRMAQKLDDPNDGVILLAGRGAIVAALNLWTLGDRIYDDGRTPPGPGFLKRLKGPPPDVWEIKITAPTPQVRVFGRFAEMDSFVATDMYTRTHFGRGKSRAWTAAMQTCDSDWRMLFHGWPPLTGSRMADFVLENFDDVPL